MKFLQRDLQLIRDSYHAQTLKFFSDNPRLYRHLETLGDFPLDKETELLVARALLSARVVPTELTDALRLARNLIQTNEN